MKIRQFLPFFSYVFHPIFITLYGTFFYFLVAPHAISTKNQLFSLLQVFIITVLLPLAIFFLLISLGKVKSFTEATVAERKVPIVVQIILLFCLISLKNYTGMEELYYFYLGGLFCSFAAWIITLADYKVSLHMMGISALATFIYTINYIFELSYINSVAFAVVCVGLVASSRLYMKSHTANELILGAFLGFIFQYLCWSFYFFIYKM